MKRPKLWPGMIFGLIGMNVCIVAVTVVLAHSDRSFAVESDYYQKALKWDGTQRQRGVNKDLGWEFRIGSQGAGATKDVSVVILDRDGRPVQGASVRLVAFHNARPGDREEETLAEKAPGDYRCEMPLGRPGLWQFTVTAVRGSDVFTSLQEHMVGTDPAPTSEVGR